MDFERKIIGAFFYVARVVSIISAIAAIFHIWHN